MTCTEATPLIESLTQNSHRLHELFERSASVWPTATAVHCGDQHVHYADLDDRANRLAHYLSRLGVQPSDRIGLLIEPSVHLYVALLATLKAGAAFVPLDPAFPSDRLAFIAKDASVRLLVSTSAFAETLVEMPCPVIKLDAATKLIAKEPKDRLKIFTDGDAPCYIIYTSGTTGHPKGVVVNHSNICTFLAACTPIYGVTTQDRVYQGMTLAFDFTVEEIWPCFAAGATLVVGPTDHRRFGAGLTDFLIENEITVLCCVPTLLATLDRDIPKLRTLLVGGEACPADLVARWSRPGRRMLNTYGPAEATVTATWGELVPGRPVTIGKPLPHATVYILDDELRLVLAGRTGEICIGGAGVAMGYVNRQQLTADRFVPDLFDGRPEARLYRTGDLGRVTSDGEIEYLGRIDTQVKIRGNRVELSEIEAVLLEDESVANAIVALTTIEGKATELTAYVTARGAIEPEVVRTRLHESSRQRLPNYMVPTFIEILDKLPILPSGKADRSRLPDPRSARLAATSGAAETPPATPLERDLAAVWQRVLGSQDVSADADFFRELGGHSLLAALVVSEVRRNPTLRHVAIADLYAQPTIRGLARLIETTAPRTAKPAREPRRHSNLRTMACGSLQFALLYSLFVVLGAPVLWILTWIGEFAVSKLFLAGATILGMQFVVRLLVPPIVKWLLVGRFRPGRYPLWGWYYCRWWLVRKAMSIAPLDTLSGSPLMAVYARLLGARIGKECHIVTGKLQVPDLIEIGDGAHLGYGVDVEPFAVEDGWLVLAPIRIGARTFVGANAVVMLGGQIGDDAIVLEQSLVARDQAIPAGETWVGSPSQRLEFDSRLCEIGSRAAPRGWSPALLGGFVAGFIMLESLPFLLALPGVFLTLAAARVDLRLAVAIAHLVGLAFVLLTCATVAVGKRLVMRRALPGVYPLRSGFGLRKWIADKLMSTSLALTNSLYATLYAVPWLRLLGAKVGPRAEVSTVSNIDPDLLAIGAESFVADLAVIGAARYHAGQIGLGATELGVRSFVGNAALIPGGTRLANGSLIGVQSVPPNEPVGEGTSWLGSPAIFLPRRQASEKFDESLTFRPTAKRIAGRFAVEFLRLILPATFGFLLILTMQQITARLSSLSIVALAASLPAVFFISALLAVVAVAALKWLIVGRYRPRAEPMWSYFVWRTELITALYENVAVPWLLKWFTGTPFMAPLLRLFGAKIGRRAYIETTFLTEFDLVRVGDDSAVGGFASLQTHLFEDRVMKMSVVTVGSECSIGPRSVVLYDATLAAGARLDALSLAMKGEILPAVSHWRGIPARAID